MPRLIKNLLLALGLSRPRVKREERKPLRPIFDDIEAWLRETEEMFNEKS